MVKRNIIDICIKDVEALKDKLISWGQEQDVFVLLDSSNYREKYSNYSFIAAFWPKKSLVQIDEKGAFDSLRKFKAQANDWIFGYLSYDLKNDVEDLKSNKLDGLKFPALHFFQPSVIFFQKDQKLEVSFLEEIDQSVISELLEKILNFQIKDEFDQSGINIKNRIEKDIYIKDVEQLKYHIKRGDIYEANFCQEFYSEKALINPAKKYKMLQSISTTPFACFYKLNQKYLLCASPERYLKKIGDKIISQPIKGTAKRGSSALEDIEIAKNLENDQKERAENVMIVDLVRNDLSKTAKRGSVKVEELCKIYTFQQVHQMISTISSIQSDEVDQIDVIKNSFPMGSMTGAPKISAMKLIEEYESSKRGLYSGSVGYFEPNGDFDFNVVIRSILYNAKNQYLSFTVGSAITDKSDSEREFEETLLKAKALFNILEDAK